MIMTTMGSEYWPKTVEARDADSSDDEVVGAKQLAAVRDQIRALLRQPPEL